MTQKIIITNGTIVDPDRSKEFQGDLLIQDSVIEEIGNPGAFSQVQDAFVVDAKNRLVTPGLVDIHVHLREPGEEWKETIYTGTKAAIAGGFTTVCCMPNTSPVNDSEEITHYILKKAKEAGFAKVYPLGAVSIGLKGKEMAPLSELYSAGCIGFTDDGRPVLDPGLMRRALEWAAMHGAPIACHEEEYALSNHGAMNEGAMSYKLGLVGWPRVAEEVMIARDIELARITQGKVHIQHVTTARGVELIRRGKNDGVQVTGEATPHHLFLTEQAIGDYDTNAKVNPPLREDEDRRALLEGVNDGTLDLIASDHAPHDIDSKRIEFSKAYNGLIGLQSTLPLVLEMVREGHLSLVKAVSLLTTKAATVMGLKEGKIAKGFIADIAIIDSNYEWEFTEAMILSKSKNSPFLGRGMKGIVETVIVDGSVVMLNRKFMSDE
jgi:dihydroorotase